MKERLKVLILWVLVVCLQTFVPSMESSNGQSDQTHASITRTAIYIASADVINNVIDLEKHNSSAAIETVIEYFSKCYSFLYRWGLCSNYKDILEPVKSYYSC